jgi:transcriptional regulator with XRE-family HTH domain
LDAFSRAIYATIIPQIPQRNNNFHSLKSLLKWAEMPNPSGRMDDREREICSRVRIVRERLNQSERNFALLLGITRDRLAGIEYSRTPLQLGIALRMATLTGCNLKWLAEGRGPERGPLPRPDLTTQITPRLLFSSAWDTHLKAILTKSFGQTWEASEENPIIGGLSAEEYSIEEITGYFRFLPTQLHWNFYASIANMCRDFAETNRVRITELNAVAETGQKNLLPSSSLKSKTGAGMKTEIQKLIERVKRKASKPGAKAALAKELCVAPARISEWLAGEKEPGGDYTLRLFRWLEQQERKK